METSVVSITKIGNSAPRVGIEPTSLAVSANALTITIPRLPDVTTLPKSTCLCGSLSERSVQNTNYIYIYIYIYICNKVGINMLC